MNFFKEKFNSSSNKNNNFINPKVLEVNLVKDEVSVEFDWSKHLVSLFFTLLVAGLFIAEIYYGLDWWQKQEEERTTTLNNELQLVSQEVKNINNNSKDFTAFKDKLTLTKQLADSHIYWTNFFNFIERNTLNSVSYSGFSGDVDGIYSLSATAKTFSDISWQVKALKDNNLVELVRVDSGSAGRPDDSGAVIADNSVSFSLNLKVKPEIFFRQAE